MTAEDRWEWPGDNTADVALGSLMGRARYTKTGNATRGCYCVSNLLIVKSGGSADDAWKIIQMRSLLTCLVLVTAAFISGTTASWWTRTRDKIEDAATTAAIVAGVGALGGKRASDTDVIPESVMAVLRETCPEVVVSQSVPWTEVLSFAFWEADANQDGQLNGAETEQFAQLVGTYALVLCLSQLKNKTKTLQLIS
ncbi:hypothetical protein BaRGS_00031509, partial [Batillaria attramentaria]